MKDFQDVYCPFCYSNLRVWFGRNCPVCSKTIDETFEYDYDEEEYDE